MLEFDAARVLLLRAIEENDPEAVPEPALAAATEAAGDCEDTAAWFLRRASFLLEHIPRRAFHRRLLELRRPAEASLPLAFVFGLLLGLASNEFGPDDRIHLLFNPLMALVAWNLGLYGFLAVHAARSLGRRGSPAKAVAAREPASPASREAEPAGADSSWMASLPWLLRTTVARLLWKRWLRWKAREAQARDAAGAGTRAAATLSAFLALWLRAAPRLTLLRLERLFHAAALGLVVGAVAGMYVRGLFLDYNVVWRSTFIRSESAIAFLMNVLLGPAAALLGVDLSAQLDFGRLTGEAGMPAAAWIHLYTVTALVVVAGPRAVLVAWESLRIRVLASRVSPAFDDGYFVDILRRLRESRRQEVVDDIRESCRKNVDAMAKALADFVCLELYDGAIRAELEAYREQGGRLRDLEDRVRAATEDFAPRLEARVQAEEGAFEAALAAAVRAAVTKSLGPSVDLGARPRRRPLEGSGGPTAGQLVGPIGDSLTDVVGAAVSAAVALGLGTISGGFGKSLGMAILVSVVHSGPLAFVVGALVGVVAAGAGLWMGREALTEAVKDYALPAALARTLLWKGRMQKILDEGREKTRETVKAKVAGAMEPLADTVAEEVWQRIDGLPPR